MRFKVGWPGIKQYLKYIKAYHINTKSKIYQGLSYKHNIWNISRPVIIIQTQYLKYIEAYHTNTISEIYQGLSYKHNIWNISRPIIQTQYLKYIKAYHTKSIYEIYQIYEGLSRTTYREMSDIQFISACNKMWGILKGNLYTESNDWQPTGKFHYVDQYRDCKTLKVRVEHFNTYTRTREREMFYLTTHSTHFIYGYMASYIWLRTILIVREETCCHHIGYSFWLAARVLLYAPSQTG